MNKKKLCLWTAAAAAFTAYSAIKGKGIFNKVRFKEQHEAIGRYVEGHYPNAVYSPVQETESGYAVIVRRPRMADILLFMMQSPDGNFVFKETIAS